MAGSVGFVLDPRIGSAREAREALEGMAFCVRPLRRRRPPRERLTIYHDTWDAALRRKGWSLRRDSSTWRLLRGSQLIAEKEERSPQEPSRGTIVDRARALTRHNPFIPYLRAAISEEGWSIGSRNRVGVRATLRSYRFSNPHAPEQSASRIALLIDANEDSPEALYLRAVLRRSTLASPLVADVSTLGICVLDLKLPGLPVPRELAVSESDAFAAAAGKVLRCQLRRLEACWLGASKDLDPEYLHDMRVASRVLRYSLRFLRPLVGAEEALLEHLRWLGGELGAVRDQDVFLMLLRREGGEPESPLSPVVERTRADAVRRLGIALADARYRSLLVSLGALASRARDLEGDVAAEPVAVAAGRVIRKALSPVSRLRELDPGRLSSKQLHEARMRLRRLRYACELFRPAFGGRMRRLVAEIVAFQDCLGQHQDASVAIARLQALLEEASRDGPCTRELAEEAGSLVAWQLSIQKAGRARLDELWLGLPRLVRRLKRRIGPRAPKRAPVPEPSAMA